MGPYELGVTNALWQKAFTPEWGATRRQAGGKVKRCVAVFDVLIPLNEIPIDVKRPTYQLFVPLMGLKWLE